MIAVVCHDAGGAEIISSYVRQHDLKCAFALNGPARRIFERKLGAVETMAVTEAVAVADWVLCGSSWQSDMELDAIQAARDARKRSVVFLDHWVNYRERFQRDGRYTLPDELWVGDGIARQLAQRELGELPVTVVENPYILDLRAELAAQPSRDTGKNQSATVLYVCEPVGEHALLRYGNARHWGYVEADAVRFFLENLAALGRDVERVVIRPHPSEAPGKYDWALSECDRPISISGGSTLIADVAASDVVVGCNSMAMVVGLVAGKRVVCAIPPGGSSCVLPQPEIESLQQLVTASAPTRSPEESTR
jgi:hypothetical protein